jgi:hypothetical protein
VPLTLAAAVATACGPIQPTGPTASSGQPSPASPHPSQASAGASFSASPDLPAIDPGVGRLVWLVDRAGGLGVWTTDLAGGDSRTYQAGLDEGGISLRDPQLAGEDVVLIREAATAPAAELWVMSRTAPPRLLLDRVVSFVVRGEREVIAIRDVEVTRSIWRVPLGGPAPAAIAQLAVPDHGPQVGPFGFAISPDGGTVAAGWVGGPVEVIGPVPGSHRDIGAPLVVADDGRIVAVTGLAGEAYLVEGDRLVALAPADSDPLAVPGSGVVAWGSVDADGGLLAVEVRDVLAGTSETHPAGGPATNVRVLTASHVVLEATAFDPATRSVTVIDRRDGRFETFEAPAPGPE